MLLCLSSERSVLFLWINSSCLSHNQKSWGIWTFCVHSFLAWTL